MYPTLQHGDYLAIEFTKKIKAGDIILFNNNQDQTFTVHRVLRYKNSSYITRGDNNRAKDNFLVKPNLIHGKVIYLIRNSKKIYVLNGFLGYILHYILILRKIFSFVCSKFYRQIMRLL